MSAPIAINGFNRTDYINITTFGAVAENCKKYLEKGMMEDLESLYPFLSKSTLRKIAKKRMERQNLEGLGEIMPVV